MLHTPQSRHFLLFNVAWFQVVWFLAVVYQMRFIYWILALFFLHFLITKTKKTDTVVMVLGVLVGCVIDNILAVTNVFVFSQQYSVGLIPLWLVVLWAAFALSIYHSLSIWLKSRVIQMGVGAIAGPVSYFAGHHFDAVQFSYSPLTTFVILGIIWAFLLPVLIELVNFLNQILSKVKSKESI
ncbi:DUF2878 domain-containing protein [Alteromonas ponticola]|uniref:DUF2878 domain-containing protein n=2 Tax=Alteromonas aquimaris TaxID=2998417 RepID=A0ABT3P935_9ALTE|nr:DUF2878 domain-containing protein [Alteromonas aquimaris]